MVTNKCDSSDDETIDVIEFDETPLFLDKQYGIRTDGDTFMIRNSIVSVDESSDITIIGKRFGGTKRLLEL
jgi:hypothetical protein